MKNRTKNLKRTTTAMVAFAVLASPMTTFAVPAQTIHHDVLLKGTNMNTENVRPDQSFELYTNEGEKSFKKVRQQLENQYFGVLLVSNSGDKELLDAKKTSIHYQDGVISVPEHTEFKAYTGYSVFVLVKSEYQQALKGNFPDVSNQEGLTFQTGSELFEPTSIEMSKSIVAPTVEDTVTLTLKATDDYGLPANGEISVSIQEAGKRLADSSVLTLKNTTLENGVAELELTNKETEKVNLSIDIKGENSEKKVEATVTFKHGKTNEVEIETTSSIVVGSKTTFNGKAFDRYDNLITSELHITASTLQGEVSGSVMENGSFDLDYTASTLKGLDNIRLHVEGSDKTFEKEVVVKADKPKVVTPTVEELEEGVESTLSFKIQDQFGNLVEDNEDIQLVFDDESMDNLQAKTKDGFARFTVKPETSGSFTYSVQTADGFMNFSPSKPLVVSGNEDKHFTIDINKDVEIKEDGTFDFDSGTWSYSGNRKKVLTDIGEFKITGSGSLGYYSHLLNETTATFELDVKSIINGGTSTGFNSVMLIRTGDTGLSVAFFPDKLVIGDNPFSPKLTYSLDASVYHTYRIVKDENKATVYVDGELIGSFTLANGTGYGQHQFFFGDGTSNSFSSEAYYKNIRIAPGQALYLN